MQQARQLAAEDTNRYFKQLRTRAKVADSVVRKCLLLSKQEYVLEQKVSIEVGPPRDNWHAIIWLDNGRDLSQSVQGSTAWYASLGDVLLSGHCAPSRRPSSARRGQYIATGPHQLQAQESNESC